MKNFVIDACGCIRTSGRLLIPNDGDLRRDILEECHHSKYIIHPDSSKMYADMKRLLLERYEASLLLEMYEVGYSGVCEAVLDLSAY